MRPLPLAALALLAVATSVRPAAAAWPNSPFANLPVAVSQFAQENHVIVSDGAGGAIVVWDDLRNGVAKDIYAHHILASGVLDPSPTWTAGGRWVSGAPSNQEFPDAIEDGAGGALICWTDLRGSAADIYAQHVLASGAIDPAWPANGRAICTAASLQLLSKLTSDGAGGAIITWNDYRDNATTEPDIYAQHVLASGVVDPAWPVNGTPICTAIGQQSFPFIVSDGAGGALVTWQDRRTGATSGFEDVYVQHVYASGIVDGAWPVNGRALCTAANTQFPTAIVSDGAGGGVVVWNDLRSGNYDIYAHHVLATGAVDAAWPLDGRSVCTAANQQTLTTGCAISDGAGGALVAWYDIRGVSFDVYAHHVQSSGALDPAWPTDGRALTTATNSQIVNAVASDGAGGLFAAWRDFRTGISEDVYVQHVSGSGVVDPTWPVDGKLVSSAGGNQQTPKLVGDGNGGVIAVFTDTRSGATDIFAQRVGRYGHLGTPEAEVISVEDVPNDQGGRIKVSWRASYLEGEPSNLVTSYKVFRSVPPNLAAAARAAGGRVMTADDADAAMFDRPGDLLATVAFGTTYYWEYLATVNADFLANYSFLVPTAQDSTAAGAPETAVMIQARTAGSQHWESFPAKGHSVDNLGPATPAPFTGQYAAGTVTLHWSPNLEPDLAGYRLYRGTSASFTPSPANLISAQGDTGHVDPAGQPFYYKLTAVDVHGNESPVATLLPQGTVSVDGPLAIRSLSIAPAAPNPATTGTLFRIALAERAMVRLTIHDPSGRLVRELVRGERGAGEHAEAWDLLDAGGRAVSAGLYFARLESGGRMRVRAVAVTR